MNEQYTQLSLWSEEELPDVVIGPALPSSTGGCTQEETSVYTQLPLPGCEGEMETV